MGARAPVYTVRRLTASEHARRSLRHLPPGNVDTSDQFILHTGAAEDGKGRARSTGVVGPTSGSVHYSKLAR